jgi:CheY-like chemotaxis protein
MALQLEFNDKHNLWAAMIHHKADRVFIATNSPYALGSEVPVQVTLPDLPIRIMMIGSVVGLRPPSEKFAPGVFVRFAEDEIDKCRDYLGLTRTTDLGLGRRAVRVDCRLSLKVSEITPEADAITQNLSESGILAECGAPLRMGQKVTLTLTLDEGSSLVLAAEVIWSRHEAKLVGFSFLDLDEASRAKLASTTQRLVKATAATQHLRSILLIEDDVALLDLLRESLSSEGYTVYPLQGGEHAVASIRRLKPKLVLLGVVMPGMDGKEICRRMRADSEMASIHVVLMSGLSSRELHSVAEEAGASDYLSKPFGLGELQSVVKRYLPLPEKT